MEVIDIHTSNESDTRSIAQLLAPRLRKSDVVLLTGDLAAGKTTFIRELSQSVGVTSTVSSPTYTIANMYDASDFQIIHIDAYRLDNIQEFHYLGLDEYFDDSVTLVEWGNLIEESFSEFLCIKIEAGESGGNSRIFHFSSNATSWKDRLDKMEIELDQILK